MSQKFLFGRPVKPHNGREIFTADGAKLEIPDYVDLEPGWEDEDAKRGFFTYRPHEEPCIRSRKILSLFDCSGEWSKPYREAGYTVYHIDLKNWHMPQDVLKMATFDFFESFLAKGMLAALGY